MTRDLEWRRTRKTVLGASLILGPVLILIGTLIASGVYDGDDDARYLASIADHETEQYAGGVIAAIGALFLAPIVVALGHLVRVRHLRFAIGAGVVAMFGALIMPGAWMVFTIVDHQAAIDPARAPLAAFFDRAQDSDAMAPLFVSWIALSLGLVLLAAGLLWANTVPRWMPVLMLAGAVLVFAGDSDVLGTVANALLLIGLGGIAWMILRASVEEWEEGDLAHHAPSVTTSSPPPAIPAH